MGFLLFPEFLLKASLGSAWLEGFNDKNEKKKRWMLTGPENQ